MRALSGREREFVWALYTPGLQSAVDAIRLTSYASESEGSMRVQAHRLMHRPSVIDAIIEENRALVNVKTPFYMRALEAIAFDTGHKDQRGALNDLLQRGHMAAVVKVEHKKVPSDAEAKAEAIAAAKRLGYPLDKLGIVVDAEYTDITPDVDSLEGVPL